MEGSYLRVRADDDGGDAIGGIYELERGAGPANSDGDVCSWWVERRDCESEGVTGGTDEEAVEMELFVSTLDTDPEPDAAVEAEEVAEGERERGRVGMEGSTDGEGTGAATRSSVDGTGKLAAAGRGCFLGRPRGRLTATVVAGEATEGNGVIVAIVATGAIAAMGS